jgi:steroid delta-isomerase-like uncharacterized protein
MVAAIAFASTAGAQDAARESDCPATTEAENVALARQWHEEVINRRNPAALQTILADKLVHHAAGPYPDILDGAGVAAMMDDFLGAFPDLRYDFTHFIVQDDLVVERYSATGTQQGALGQLPASGRKATWTGINIFRIQCGRIAEVWSEVDALGRARQLAGG